MAKKEQATMEAAPETFSSVAAPEAVPVAVDEQQSDGFGRSASTLASGPKFQVSWSDHSEQITARDAVEAWAIFCDTIKKYPSPKAGTVVKL